MPERPTDRWQEVDDLFDRALDLDPKEWERFLEDHCTHDEQLRHAVSELLVADLDSGHFLTGPAQEIAGAVLVEALRAMPCPGTRDRAGQQIGPWQLIRKIGRGGMADVYLGERADGAFEQRVAVKIQRRGTDTEDVVARFRTERQILSELDHPNIARLLDGGATEDGLPYLVMDYVEGRPITEYCEERALPITERLQLFLQVSQAVQAAHARLVVHRDIKPSNVLVTGGGQVKLLDFGIAKLLDPTAWPGEGGPRTRTGFRPLTPEYASPEQIRGEAITTASDIYQLGLLLYRLLTGGRPYAVGGSRRTVEDAITETRPTKPSDFVEHQGEPVIAGLERRLLVRRLKGDLDTILLAALRKEAAYRYQSAHEMAEDVRRHLEGRPIAARQESRMYRVGKFLLRNPWAAPAATVFLGAVGIYIGTLQYHGRQLEAERNTARLEAARANTTQDFLVGLFQTADPFAPVPTSRRDVRVSDVMEEGVRRARQELADQPELRTAMLGTIGDVFLGLGDPERAVALSREAYEGAEAAFGEASPEAAVAYRKLITPMTHRMRQKLILPDTAVWLGVEALSRLRRTLGEAHIETTRAKLDLAEAMGFSGTGAAGEVIVRDALGNLDGRETQVERARALTILQTILASYGRWSEAAEVGRQSIEASVAAYGDDHLHTWAARLRISQHLPDPVQGDSLRESAIQAFEAQLGPLHDETIRAHLIDASILNRRGDYGPATDAYRTVIERRLARGDDVESGWLITMSGSLGDAARTAGRYEEAEAAYRTTLDLMGQSDRYGADQEAAIRARLAWTFVNLGRTREALAEALAARKLLDHTGPNSLIDCALARALRANGRMVEADSAIAMAAVHLAETGYVVRDYHPCFGLIPGP